MSQVLAVGGSGPAPFSPLDIGGCTLWLHADSLSLANNDPVTTWSDSSANGKDATGSGASAPTYKTAILNGLPVVQFGVSHQLSFAAGTTTIPFTCFVVGCSSRTSVTNPPQEWIVDKDLIMAADVALAGAPNGDWGTYNGAAWSGSSYSVLSSTYRVCAYTRSTTSNYTLATNGTVETFTSGGTPLTLSQASIGSDQFSQFLEGSIAEAIIYDTALSGTDRGRVETYLATKYGL